METRQLGGLGFLVCNAALFANGLIAHTYAPTEGARKAGIGRMTSATLWSASSVFLTKYGDRAVDQQQARLEEKLCAYLHQHGIPLDAGAIRKADAETREGWFKKIEDFCYAHPIEISNSYEAIAGIGFGISGILRRREGNTQTGNANIGVSALKIIGALACILIPEKTPEQIADKGQSGTLWGKIQEHPLGYVRWIFLGGDVVDGMGALGEYKGARALPKGDPYRTGQFAMSALTVSAMGTSLASDWITSGSKKAGGDPDARNVAQQQLIQEAARHIVDLPEAQQQQLAQGLAQYLTQQHELRFADRNPKQLAAELLQRVHVLTAPQLSQAEPKTTVEAGESEAQKLMAEAHLAPAGRM